MHQIRFGGWAGRSHDETFPLPHGYPGDETLGPGGLAAALRSVTPTLELWRAVADHAPGAWFVNMANPMSILLDALHREGARRCIGLCELPGKTLQRATGLLGVDAPRSGYVGVNHQGWFVQLEHDGQDLLPALFARLAATPGGGRDFVGIDVEVLRRLHALPLPYLRLFYHREDAVRRSSQRHQDRGRELDELATNLHAEYARSIPAGGLSDLLHQRSMPWNELALVPALVALLGGPPARLYVSSANAGAVPWLPDGAIVETAATLSASGVQRAPPPAAALTPRIRDGEIGSLLRGIVAFEQAATTAALCGEAGAVAAALRQHPFGIDADTAAAMTPATMRAVEAGAPPRHPEPGAAP